ncbi:MAG: FecR domain-containing protein [Bacteroidetes bacterium]|nr:FecR domain-containing protein [Bacteroidota bacterium]
MNRLFYSLFGIPPSEGDHDARNENIDNAVQEAMGNVRDADPETPQQWARLQSSLAQGSTNVIPVRNRLVPRVAFAVAAVALIAAGAFLYYTPTQSVPERIATGRGEQQQVSLADGSEVRLHHTSELVVDRIQSGAPRHVSLSGEAFFRVRRNDTPFVITADRATVEVLGTEFNVRVRDDVVEVAVKSGTVKVRSADSSIILTQSQIGVMHANVPPQYAGTIPAEDYPGWMSGKLFLNKTTLADACREIELRFNATIVIADIQMQGTEMNGVLDARTARSAVVALCEVTHTRFMRDGNAFRIY